MTLTREEILAKKSGKELNELVMQHIFKMIKKPEGESFTWVHEVDGDIVDWQPAYFSPSTNISAAWDVLERMQGSGWSWDMKMNNLANEVEVRIGRGQAVNKSVPLAICKAALIANLDAIKWATDI